MKQKRTSIFRVFLAVLPALLLALVLRPGVALAEDTYTVKYPGLGVLNETVTAGNSPTFSGSSESYDNILFWYVNVDVTLTDGTQISGGQYLTEQFDPLTTEQVRQIVVDKDLEINYAVWTKGDPIEFRFSGSYFLEDPYEQPNPYGGEVIYNLSNPHLGYTFHVSKTCPQSLGADNVPEASPRSDHPDWYVFDYWQLRNPCFIYEDDVAAQACDTTRGKWVPSGTHLTSEQLARATILGSNQDIVPLFHIEYPITYTTDGHGSVSPTSEKVPLEARKMLEGGSLVGATPTANKGYEFVYWTASDPVQIPGESNKDTIYFGEGDPISADQLTQIKVFQGLTFTAHFKKDPNYVEPDDSGDSSSNTIKSADSSAAKPVPKTGDVLPGATAAVALGAGVVVAGAALLRKRFQ